jgi:hypothetical protein
MSATTRPQLLTPSSLLKLILVWAPIVGGVVHQFLMLFLGIDGIYVFVNPPGTIYPIVSLQYTWWIVLILGSSMMCILAYLDRVQSIPNRYVVPFYIYILFLLYLVKPI